MPSLSCIDQITERVELLMARHAQLQRSNALLAEQVAALSLERDSLQSRLRAARARVDLLVDRLAEAAPGSGPEPETAPAATPPTTVPAGASPLPLKEERP